MSNIEIDFPKSWELMPVSDAVVSIPTNGKKIPQKQYIANGTLPIIDQGQDFIGGYTDNMDMKVECELPVIVFGDHTRIVKYVNTTFAPGADGVKILQPQRFFNPRLLSYFIQYLTAILTNYGYARHYQHLSKATVPAPPFAEQHRIVAKIEELFSELDKGIENLKTAQAQLKVYRQALLKHAFEGKLTAQWREKNKAKLEDASVLQKKLSSRSIKTTLLDKDIVGFKVNFFKEVPHNWVVATIQNIATINPTYKKTDIDDNDLVNFVLMASVSAVNGAINIETLRTFGDVKKGFTSFAENDVIFAKITPCMENGKMAIIPKLIKNIGFGSTEFHVLRPSDLVESRFLYFYISSEIFRSDAEHNMTGAVGQKRVPTNYIKASEIPLPCIFEQMEIVKLLEEKITEIDQLDLTITTSLQQADALRQSILKKAFSGQLVPQDPNDESAANLLSRIKKEQLTNKIRAKS